MRLSAALCLVVLCAVAARASAAPEPFVFRLSVIGATTAEWEHTDKRVGLCAGRLRSEGVRTVRFHSRKSVVVGFIAGRIRAVDLRGLVGTMTVTGLHTVTQDCGVGPQTSEEPCAKTTRRLRDGRTRLTSNAVGRVTIGVPRSAVRRTDCPLQPADIVATPLGPPPGPLRIPTSLLANTGIAKLTLTARAKRRMTYGDPDSGTSVQRTSWKFTLVRERR